MSKVDTCVGVVYIFDRGENTNCRSLTLSAESRSLTLSLLPGCWQKNDEDRVSVCLAPPPFLMIAILAVDLCLCSQSNAVAVFMHVGRPMEEQLVKPRRAPQGFGLHLQETDPTKKGRTWLHEVFNNRPTPPTNHLPKTSDAACWRQLSRSPLARELLLASDSQWLAAPGRHRGAERQRLPRG